MCAHARVCVCVCILTVWLVRSYHPYSCRNAPFKSLEELLLVKGITPELFYGKDEIPGIRNYLTIQGDGAVNINTADPVVLEALSDDLDSSMIEEMVAYRNDEKNDLYFNSGAAAGSKCYGTKAN